jgi:hypothetical protein
MSSELCYEEKSQLSWISKGRSLVVRDLWKSANKANSSFCLLREFLNEKPANKKLLSKQTTARVVSP